MKRENKLLAWGRMEEWKGAKGWIREEMYMEREERRGNGKRVMQNPLQNSIWILLSAVGKNLKRKFFVFFYFASSDMPHITTSPPTRGAGSSQRRTDGR